eukprot:COSAG06_NODE_65308_length_257_cov_0.658228_1_plen_39_part_10
MHLGQNQRITLKFARCARIAMRKSNMILARIPTVRALSH